MHEYQKKELEIGMKVLAEYNCHDAPGVFYTASVAEIPEQQNKCLLFYFGLYIIIGVEVLNFVGFCFNVLCCWLYLCGRRPRI